MTAVLNNGDRLKFNISFLVVVEFNTFEFSKFSLVTHFTFEKKKAKGLISELKSLFAMEWQGNKGRLVGLEKRIGLEAECVQRGIMGSGEGYASWNREEAGISAGMAWKGE